MKDDEYVIALTIMVNTGKYYYLPTFQLVEPKDGDFVRIKK